MTSVHKRDDVRIFKKECMSLTKHYDVSLIVADGKGDQLINGVHIYDVGKASGRVKRMFATTSKIYKKSLDLQGDVYHAHDPELLPILLKLKKKRKQTIFDAHEDFPAQLLSKQYINKIVVYPMSWAAKIYEYYAAKNIDGWIGVHIGITKRYKHVNKRCVVIANYAQLETFPRLDQMAVNTSKSPYVCFVGGMTAIRGIQYIVEAFASKFKDKCDLKLVGDFQPISFKKYLESMLSSNNIQVLGFQNSEEVANIMSHAIAGLVTYLPVPNHINACPNKMFEYMASGIPIIASNFEAWQKIIEGQNCGICVDPTDAGAIADAVSYLINNPKEAKIMGENGRRLVESIYNWRSEEEKLFLLYKNLLQK